MNIIAYTYEADFHCYDCTLDRFGIGGDIPDNAKDNEGNSVHPVFSTDETPARLSTEDGGYDVTCGDCHCIIEKQIKE